MKNFKPIQDTTESSPTGEHNRHHPNLPIGKSLTDVGLESANVNGEATVKARVIKLKKQPKSTKATTLKDYDNHRKVEVYPNVFVILNNNSKSEITNFTDFIEVSEATVDIVDIVPKLYDSHYDIIKHSSTRFMVGDSVTVNFKYRSINDNKKFIQSKPRIITDIKFVALNDRTAVIAYLEDNDFYPINELDSNDTD